MIFSIYNLKTGELERVVDCPASMVSLQYDAATHGVIEGSFFGDEYYILDGTPQQFPEKPSEFHYFDFLTRSWTLNLDLVVSAVRQRREALLAQSDWTQLPDVPLATKDAWATYRQALRDITTQPGFPLDVVWPIPPSN